jgi:hypothetical protein
MEKNLQLYVFPYDVLWFRAVQSPVVTCLMPHRELSVGTPLWGGSSGGQHEVDEAQVDNAEGPRSRISFVLHCRQGGHIRADFLVYICTS